MLDFGLNCHWGKNITVPENNKNFCLIIFAREPEEGKVKTRLLDELSVSVVTKLYRNFAEDVLMLAKKVHCQKRMVYYTSSNLNLPFLSKFKNDFTLRKQKGKDLGERMYAAFKESQRQGFEHIVIIGTDCLTLTVGDIENAFQKLQSHDCVLGPCPDGGYYLIGLNDPIQDLFLNIPWSTPDVLSLTLDRIKLLKKKVFFLEEREDIDTIEDLKRVGQYFEKQGFKNYTALALESIKKNSSFLV